MRKAKEPQYFIHYCCVSGCSKWGGFGLGVFGRLGIKGKWYCGEHYRDALKKIEADKLLEREAQSKKPHEEKDKQGVLL